MCLLVLAWKAHPRYRLIVAANRDEYHDRLAEPLGSWPAPEEMLAGRDLRAGGTWLGVDRRRRFGIITNYREVAGPAEAVPMGVSSGRPPPPSRGGLIPEFMRQDAAPGEHLSSLEPKASAYGGFNLLLADGGSLWYGSNRVTPFARELSSGIYGLSNERLDTPWPKLRRVRAGFEAWLRESASHDADAAELFALLRDPRPATEAEGLPRTGLPPEWERTLSAPFVQHPQYGTRCSTVVLIEPSGDLLLAERRFDREGRCTGESKYRLSGGTWPD